MNKQFTNIDVIGGESPPVSNLWEDLHALAALVGPEKLPLPVATPPAA